MESIKKKVTQIPRAAIKTAAFAALAVMLAMLLTWACISTSNAANMRKKYTSSLRSIGEELYGAMYMMALEYEDASLAGAEVEDVIIPSMKEYYTRSLALNDALTRAYGAGYLVMDESLTTQLDQAFAAYDDAFTTGQSTDGAAALMTSALADVQSALTEHYSDDAVIKFQ
jgi:hypothetical protein